LTENKILLTALDSPRKICLFFYSTPEHVSRAPTTVRDDKEANGQIAASASEDCASLVVEALTARIAMSNAGFPGQRSNSYQVVDHTALPKLGFDVGGVLSPLGNDVADMQLSADVVELLSQVQVLTGAENMVLISKVGYKRRRRIEELISRSPLLSSCFPSDRRFFSRCDEEDTTQWKLLVCRRQKVNIMVDDSYHICKTLRAAGVRCFRPVRPGRGRDVTHHDNFLSPEDAVRAVVRELTECRQRLGMPTAPFNVFGVSVPLPISQPYTAAAVLLVAQVKQDEPAALPEQENPEDSLVGWRSLPGPVPAEPTKQSQSNCKGRHLHQPANRRRKLLSFREWQNECFEQAKIARCQSCVEKWCEELQETVRPSWQ
jgi:hypothetical protein